MTFFYGGPLFVDVFFRENYRSLQESGGLDRSSPLKLEH